MSSRTTRTRAQLTQRSQALSEVLTVMFDREEPDYELILAIVLKTMPAYDAFRRAQPKLEAQLEADSLRPIIDLSDGLWRLGFILAKQYRSPEITEKLIALLEARDARHGRYLYRDQIKLLGTFY